MSIYKQRRDEIENQLNKGALWAVVYGDLMSYLMIFFLVLFSFSISENDKKTNYEKSISNIQKAFGGKENEKLLEKTKAMEKETLVVEKIKESIKNDVLNNLIQVQQNEQKVKLVLTEGVLFDSGKAKLKESAKKVLLPIIAQLKNIPNQIVIEGHTDSLPIKGGKYANNWELSMARAYNVIEFMEKEGVPSKQLSGIGYGQYKPISDNTTIEGRGKNRRIEISFLKTE